MGVGAGPLAQEMGEKLLKSIHPHLQVFADNITQSAEGEDIWFEPRFPRRLYMGAAHFGWNRDGKRNGLSKRQLRGTLDT